MAYELSTRQRKDFRTRGHHLEPVVMVGKENVTAAVLKAIDAALNTHGLIKVKLLQSATVDKDAAARDICEALEAALVQRIGRVALIYRPVPDGDDDSDT